MRWVGLLLGVLCADRGCFESSLGTLVGVLMGGGRGNPCLCGVVGVAGVGVPWLGAEALGK